MASLSSDRYQPFTHQISETLAQVPAVATDLTTTDTRIWQITVANTTAGALTFTLKDKQATPRYICAAVSIAANTTYILAWPEGQFGSSGLNWSGSGAGLEASVVGCYK